MGTVSKTEIPRPGRGRGGNERGASSKRQNGTATWVGNSSSGHLPEKVKKLTREDVRGPGPCSPVYAAVTRTPPGTRPQGTTDGGAWPSPGGAPRGLDRWRAAAVAAPREHREGDTGRTERDGSYDFSHTRNRQQAADELDQWTRAQGHGRQGGGRRRGRASGWRRGRGVERGPRAPETCAALLRDAGPTSRTPGFKRQSSQLPGGFRVSSEVGVPLHCCPHSGRRAPSQPVSPSGH